MCLFIRKGLGAHFERFLDNLSDRFGRGPSPFHLIKHFKTSIFMFSGVAKCRSRALKSFILSPARPAHVSDCCFSIAKQNSTTYKRPYGEVFDISKNIHMLQQMSHPDDSPASTRWFMVLRVFFINRVICFSSRGSINLTWNPNNDQR